MKLLNINKSARREWVDELRKEGYKASHPNDGWVDRKQNKIHLCYPQFNDGLQVGDKMMLGWVGEKERAIRIIGVEKGTLGLLDYYLFEDLNKREDEKDDYIECGECYNEGGEGSFTYVETKANGELWKCKLCGTEIMQTQ